MHKKVAASHDMGIENLRGANMRRVGNGVDTSSEMCKCVPFKHGNAGSARLDRQSLVGK